MDFSRPIYSLPVASKPIRKFLFRTSIGLLVFACASISLRLNAQEILGEAVAGTPFGYARVNIPLNGADRQVLSAGKISLSDADGRTFYPVFSTGTLRRLLEEVLNTDSAKDAKAVTAYFMFTGDEPLTVKIYTSKVNIVRITPDRRRLLAHASLKQTWWREFSARERLHSDADDYPPIVETYLNNMLASRLRLQPTLLGGKSEEGQNEVFQAMEMLGGSENQQLVAMRDMFRAPPETDATADALPAPIRWAPPLEYFADEQLKIEPIAHRVPRECFYVRFGSWDNQVWLSYLLREYGGDLGRMVTLRGIDDESSDRFEKQLVLFKNKFADMFAGKVVEDLAFIGRDFYMREGASIGVIIQAKGNLLASQLMNERRRVQKQYAKNGATIEDVEIAGHKVSFLSTPDNSIRSYFATDDNYHLVTNSRALVERFFQVPTDHSSIAETGDFQRVRAEMPLDREDTVFTYLPSDFFHGLLAPHYQIESRRRVRASAKINMLQLARLAARNETGLEFGVEDRDIDQLISGGFLPPRFKLRFDGVPVNKDGQWQDLQRGGQRNFLPVTDVPVITATRGEVDFYNARAAYITERIPRMDPIAVGLRRFELNDDGLERLVVDALMSPMEPEKYGWLLSILGPPMEFQVAPMKDEAISVRASIDGGLLFDDIPAHQWFIAIQDEVPPVTQIRRAGFFEMLDIARATPGYIGAWPKPGFIDKFPIPISRDVNRDGFSRSIIGLWRMQYEDFSVLSFDKSRLESIRPQLDVVKTTAPAQVAFNINDLTNSNLKTWVTTLTYQRALQSSQGNPRLLHTISEQLGVPSADAREVAEELLDAKLVCPLGGQYSSAAIGSGLPYWASDKLPAADQRNVPETYETPLHKWFRGAKGSLLIDHGRLNARVFVDIQRSEKEPKVSLPSFNIFGGKK